MRLAKAMAIFFFLAMEAALVVLSASAQQPTPLPHVQIVIPTTPPAGWSPKQWSDFRARCQEVADKTAAHVAYTRDDWGVVPLCASAATEPPPPIAYPPDFPSGASAPRGTPATTPLPAGPGPESALDAQTALAAVVGPFGTPFSGGSLDACTAFPPDVAADVSSNQIVQLLNFGIWVFKQTGASPRHAGDACQLLEYIVSAASAYRHTGGVGSV
jgi:hypothetical protein